ncbi:hypothetical protein F4778DRAFT_501364 [Xylariomycetidae sp. FL2044]|nr:hypothetical protein F4778DRAFT_501364 [Xylariomycetidae sp. FL2044]
MTSFTTLVASFTGRVQRAAVGCSTIPRNVAEFTTGVAFHGLGLTVSGKVVWTTTLVACSRSGSASESSSSEATSIAAPCHGRPTAAHGDGSTRRVRARTSKVARLTAVVATTVASGTTQPKSRAVGLDVAETLAVVALLGLRGTWQRALVGLVS